MWAFPVFLAFDFVDHHWISTHVVVATVAGPSSFAVAWCLGVWSLGTLTQQWVSWQISWEDLSEVGESVARLCTLNHCRLNLSLMFLLIGWTSLDQILEHLVQKQNVLRYWNCPWLVQVIWLLCCVAVVQSVKGSFQWWDMCLKLWSVVGRFCPVAGSWLFLWLLSIQTVFCRHLK